MSNIDGGKKPRVIMTKKQLIRKFLWPFCFSMAVIVAAGIYILLVGPNGR